MGGSWKRHLILFWKSQSWRFRFVRVNFTICDRSICFVPRQRSEHWWGSVIEAGGVSHPLPGEGTRKRGHTCPPCDLTSACVTGSSMTSVWKRLQRVGKKASKFQFAASFQELIIECTNKWWVIWYLYLSVFVNICQYLITVDLLRTPALLRGVLAER